MFVVYTPEGRNAITATDLKPDLRVDPTKKVREVNASELGETTLPAEEKKQSATSQTAINHYRTTQASEHGQPLVKASEIMNSPVVTISESQTLLEAWQLMNESLIHHLPVLNDQHQLIGVISATEILHRTNVDEHGQLSGVTLQLVREVMKHQLITTQPGTDIRKLALAMTVYNTGSVVIVDQNESIQGIVTQSDLVKRLSENPPITLYA